MTRFLLTAALSALIATAAPPQLDTLSQTRLDEGLRCLLGVYSLPSGEGITITGFGGEGRALQYTLASGQFGTLRESAGGGSWQDGRSIKVQFEGCDAGALSLTQGKATVRAVRLRMVETYTMFNSDEGIKLHGKLVLPANGRAESVAVWIEGSNNDPSTDDAVWQYELARRQIAVFVLRQTRHGPVEWCAYIGL
jgi:uncharacterized protein